MVGVDAVVKENLAKLSKESKREDAVFKAGFKAESG